MTIGSILANSLMNSHSPLSAKPSISSIVSARMSPSIAAMACGRKEGVMSAR
ncbi:hypothetical protein D9M71_787070 [compost metagenome]